MGNPIPGNLRELGSRTRDPVGDEISVKSFELDVATAMPRTPLVG